MDTALSLNLLSPPSPTTTRKSTPQSPLRLPTTRTTTSFPLHCSTKPPNLQSNQTPTLHTDPTSTPTNSPTQLPTQTPPSRGLVFSLGLNTSWDSFEVGSPVVKRFISDEEERWFMWYHGKCSDGSSSGDSIGLALSNNGVHWERGTGPVQSNVDAGLVMNVSKDWWGFDTTSIRPSEVVIMSSNKVKTSSAVYWLYYTGYNNEKVENVIASNSMCLPGLAISQDGRHWARIEGEHHSGALFDVGAETEWDSLLVAAPHVVFHSSGDLRMYYHSFDVKSGQFCIGIARSRDGIKWVKLGKILGGGSVDSFDELGLRNAHVVKNQKTGGYVMAYEGVASDGKMSIGLAVSSDGLKNWRKCGEEAFLKRCVEEDGWDNEGVGSPCLVQMDGSDGEWRLYYSGVAKGGKTGIGMAVSGGGQVGNFKRWEGFHL